MKIALINENSQAAKNEIIVSTLKKVVEPLGHEVYNYGMYTADDAAQLTYVQIGILAAILLNSGAVTICFIMFLLNDIYGYVNWTKMQKRQQAKHNDISAC